MTNKERQKSLEKIREQKYGDISSCGHELYCAYCKEEEINKVDCCAKAYNRMVRENKK